ncbi:hypothetical protein [Citrobacter sp. CRE-46]|uniref:hypothetical protein n=1 Tax=Citrobacter sp. CRE-46 TaxID=1703250 RepID=UPI000D7CD7E6|nr:hypothetical protein [Citrobacter sp. CRE-46]AWS96574.1 hypothetical protein AN232_15840 [Citrobacter sp. CRE-46]
MKPDVKKIIADIKATKGNRKFCNGLAGTLQDDNYASSICKYVKTVMPERIDLLIEYTENLEAEVTDMAVQLANAESKCRELAEENAGLKSAISCHAAGFTVCEACGEENTSGNDDVCRVLNETPATDAFLAEVRAQVWIEGSEPEEFGRYWVRYETDVGTQYCSAKWMEHNFCAGSNTNIHKIWLADHSRSINSLRGVTHYTKLPDSLEGAAQ